jgi:hypothetical protein
MIAEPGHALALVVALVAMRAILPLWGAEYHDRR